MKETILITGAGPNGITGNRIKEGLERDYKILNPGSKDLNLLDSIAVDKFFKDHKVDYVIHCAVIYPSEQDDYISQNLKMFFNLARHSNEYKKMFYLGSGAEYDKSREIIKASENEIGIYIPKDNYGLFKYIIQLQCQKSKNIYNIRLFGTINPLEPYTKNVICNLSIKLIKNLPLKLRQNCRFSFTDIDDVVEFLKYGLSHNLKYKDYNLVPSETYLLSEIGDLLGKIGKSKDSIEFENLGLNKEYTGSNERIIQEYHKFTPIEESLNKVYQGMKIIADKVCVEEIDKRWKNKKQ